MQCWMKSSQCLQFNYQIYNSSSNCHLYNFHPARYVVSAVCQHYVVGAWMLSSKLHGHWPLYMSVKEDVIAWDRSFSNIADWFSRFFYKRVGRNFVTTISYYERPHHTSNVSLHYLVKYSALWLTVARFSSPCRRPCIENSRNSAYHGWISRIERKKLVTHFLLVFARARNYATL